MVASGVVNVFNSAVESNTCYTRCVGQNASVSGRGGGIYHDGMFTMFNCILRGNRIDAYARRGGGGEPAYSRGGAFFLATGSLTTKNCVWDENITIARAVEDSVIIQGGGALCQFRRCAHGE